MKYTRCAFIGSTPDELEYGYDEDSHEALCLRAAIAAKLLLLLQEGCANFISSLEQGVELWAAEACLTVARLGGKVKLCAVPTGELQAKRWHPQLRDRYFDVLEHSDEVIEPHRAMSREDDNCASDNEESVSSEDYILENADLIVVVGDRLGERADALLRRAHRCGIAVDRLNIVEN